MEVRIENVTVRYGDVVAVNDLSLEIADGELLVLLGPSGCGKTTTMRSVAGLETPSAGRITVEEEVVFDHDAGRNMSASRRNIGMVFQSYAIWPHMTVHENVAFPLRMKGVNKTEVKRRVAESLQLVGLGGVAGRSASLLSGGQMQRVAVARSVVARPATLLLDEPLSNLDAELRDKLRFELRRIQQELKITAIYVTHDQSEAFALADRVAVMCEGAIVQLGTPAELYRRPNSEFTARFLGVENIFKGTVIAPSKDADHSTVELRDGLIISASEARGVEGPNVQVCIRSENVLLHPHSKEEGSCDESISDNRIPGVVIASTYLGDRIGYHINTAALGQLYVTSAGTDGRFGKDSEVVVELPPKHLFVVPNVKMTPVEV